MNQAIPDTLSSSPIASAKLKEDLFGDNEDKFRLGDNYAEDIL